MKYSIIMQVKTFLLVKLLWLIKSLVCLFRRKHKMPGLYSKVKTVVDGETITAADRNAEHDNHITNSIPTMIDDYSANATEMQTTTDPYPGAVASLATHLAGELERLRYLIKQITGEAQWYIDPDTDLTLVATKVGAETLTNKTITAPAISSPTVTGDM